MKGLSRVGVSTAAFLAIAFPCAAARPMAITDLIGAIRVSDPQLSPDGRLVAFVRTTTDLTSGTRNADIWVVPADGSGPPRQLIAGGKSDDTPRWAPDGRHIAFMSTRDGDPQIYLAESDGGHIRQVTKIQGGVQPPMVFSPDGTMVAFVADVKQAPEPPASVHHLTRLLYRHWNEWRENVRHHVKEEQNEMFPKVRRLDLDLVALGRAIKTRKRQLKGESESQGLLGLTAFPGMMIP